MEFFCRKSIVLFTKIYKISIIQFKKKALLKDKREENSAKWFYLELLADAGGWILEVGGLSAEALFTGSLEWGAGEGGFSKNKLLVEIAEKQCYNLLTDVQNRKNGTGKGEDALKLVYLTLLTQLQYFCSHNSVNVLKQETQLRILKARNNFTTYKKALL